MRNIWHEFLTIAQHEVGVRVVETWLTVLTFKEWDADRQVVYLEVPNNFIKNWVQNHYMDLFRVHLGRLLHVKEPKVVLVSKDASAMDKEGPGVNNINPTPSHTIVPARVLSTNRVMAATARKKGRELDLHHTYTFDRLVVGNHNALACAAAKAIIERPGVLYNPLFIRSKPGLGKTHLLHAIADFCKKSRSDLVVLYQSTDRFISDFVAAARSERIQQFKDRYKKVDLLLIDDIQLIAHKTQTQEAIFAIFDMFSAASKQLVFTSDLLPYELDGISERLKSRLSSGLVVGMEAPSRETMVSIVKQRANFSDMIIDDAVVDYICDFSFSSVRDLESALVRIIAFASLTSQKITIEIASSALEIHGPSRATAMVSTNSVSSVMSVVADYFRCSVDDLRSKSREKNLSRARHVAMLCLQQFSDASLRTIGTHLGGRNHSTVLHGIEKIKRTEGDNKLECLLQSIKRKLELHA